VQLAHFEGAARGSFDDGVADPMGIQPASATCSVGCCLPPHPGQILPLYARVGSAGTERTVHHHTAAREKSAPELAACKRTRRNGDLGLLTTSTAHTWAGWAHPWVGWGGVSRPRRALDGDFNGGTIDSWRAMSIGRPIGELMVEGETLMGTARCQSA